MHNTAPFTPAITCSTRIRILAIIVFSAFSAGPRSFPRGFFLGYRYSKLTPSSVKPLQSNTKKCQGEIGIPIVRCFLIPAYGERAAYDDGLHLPSIGCVDHGVSWHAHRVARARHRLIVCWRVFMQAVHPGRHTLEAMARWTPATIPAWRFGRVRKAASSTVHRLVSWVAQELLTTWPPPPHGVRYLCGDGSHADTRGTTHPVGQQGRISQPHP